MHIPSSSPGTVNIRLFLPMKNLGNMMQGILRVARPNALITINLWPISGRSRPLAGRQTGGTPMNTLN